GLRKPRAAVAPWHRSRQTCDSHPQPERKPTPPVRNLLQSPLSLSTPARAQAGQGAPGINRRRTGENRYLKGSVLHLSTKIFGSHAERRLLHLSRTTSPTSDSPAIISPTTL